MVEGCSIWVRFGFWPVRLDSARLLFIPLLALGAWCWLCLSPVPTHEAPKYETPLDGGRLTMGLWRAGYAVARGPASRGL